MLETPSPFFSQDDFSCTVYPSVPSKHPFPWTQRLMLRPLSWPGGHRLKIWDLSLQLSADSSIPCWCRVYTSVSVYTADTYGCNWGSMTTAGILPHLEYHWEDSAGNDRWVPAHCVEVACDSQVMRLWIIWNESWKVPACDAHPGMSRWLCQSSEFIDFYIRNSHWCIDHCRWSALIPPTYVPKHLNCFHNAWMLSILVPDSNRSRGNLNQRNETWNVVPTWMEYMMIWKHWTAKPGPSQRLWVSRCLKYTQIFPTHKVAVESITMEEPRRLLTIHLTNIRKAKDLLHRTERIWSKS